MAGETTFESNYLDGVWKDGRRKQDKIRRSERSTKKMAKTPKEKVKKQCQRRADTPEEDDSENEFEPIVWMVDEDEMELAHAFFLGMMPVGHRIHKLTTTAQINLRLKL